MRLGAGSASAVGRHADSRWPPAESAPGHGPGRTACALPEYPPEYRRRRRLCRTRCTPGIGAQLHRRNRLLRGEARPRPRWPGILLGFQGGLSSQVEIGVLFAGSRFSIARPFMQDAGPVCAGRGWIRCLHSLARQVRAGSDQQVTDFRWLVAAPLAFLRDRPRGAVSAGPTRLPMLPQSVVLAPGSKASQGWPRPPWRLECLYPWRTGCLLASFAVPACGAGRVRWLR